MITLEELSTEDINKNACYIEQILELYDNDLSGKFFKYSYNGQERWLYCLDGYCTILGNDGEYILYTSFYINNSDYSLVYMEFDSFYAGVSNDEVMVWKEEETISESLRMVNRSEMINNDGYTGLVIHHQRNNETGEDLIVSYQNQYREDGHIFSCNLRIPFIVCFVKGNKVTKYMNFKTDIDYFSYDIITMKEYGIAEVLRNGSYALQRESELRRYFKVRYQKKDGTCVLAIPFSNGYKQEEMERMIRDKGFKVGVERHVLDYFNGEYEECREYKELAEAIRRYDLEYRGSKKLVKEGVRYEDSTL